MNQIKLAIIDNKDSVVELLNKVTLNLHNKGVNQWDYPWEPDIINLDIKKGHVYVLIMDDILVGTFSIKDIDSLSILSIEPNSKYLYRIAILPEYQGKDLGRQIIDFTKQYSRNFKGTLYLDCWAGNKKLRNFYTSTGFDFIGDFPEEDYIISVFGYQGGGIE